MTNPNPLPVDGVSQSYPACRHCGEKDYIVIAEGDEGLRTIIIKCQECGFWDSPAGWGAIPPAAGGVSEARVEAAAREVIHAARTVVGYLPDRPSLPPMEKLAHAFKTYDEASDALAPAAGQPVGIKGLFEKLCADREFITDGWVLALVDEASGQLALTQPDPLRSAAATRKDAGPAAPILERVNAVVEDDGDA